MGGFGCIKKGVICENNFRWKDKVEDLVEDLGALRIKEVRVTRHASRARKHSPVYHSMSRGGCQGKCGRGKSGAEMGKNEQGQVRDARGERREGGIGAKKVS